LSFQDRSGALRLQSSATRRRRSTTTSWRSSSRKILAVVGDLVAASTWPPPAAPVDPDRDAGVARDESAGLGDGDGPVDAASHAVDRITGLTGTLRSYQIRAVTSGKDALGEASVKVRFDGREFSARAASTDIVESSVRAYLAAINRMLATAPEPQKPAGDQP
jgi:hypothetical protein